MKEKMSPILFLDIDGVLNTMSGGAMLHSDKLTHLNTICAATGAEIVISSSWRRKYSLEQLREMLHAHGLDRQHKVVDVTPLSDSAYGLIWTAFSRWVEIGRWLGRRENRPAVGRRNFVIVDDCCDGQPPKHRYVEVKTSVGLTAADAHRAIEILKGVEIQP